MRPTDLDVNILRAFVTVFETGGFTATGARLGCTQAAVSIQIKRLEELLRCRVFDRSSRSLQLTRDGEALLGYARQILRLNDETVEYFSEPETRGRDPVRNRGILRAAAALADPQSFRASLSQGSS